MSIPLNTNFHIKSPFPIDSRMKVSTYALLDAIPVKYNHMVTHVEDEDKNYKYYSSTNTWVLETYNTPTVWGGIIGAITDQSDLMAYFDLYALANHTHTQSPPLVHTHVEADITNLDKYTQAEVNALTGYKSSFSTGLLKQGVLSITAGDNTTFDISAGIGIKTVWSPTDPFAPPVPHLVEFSAFTAVVPTYLGTHPASYIGISYDTGTSVSTVVQSPTPFTTSSKRNIILIGVLEHRDLTVINKVHSITVPVINPNNHIDDLQTALGVINISGNIYQASSGLEIKRTGGSLYRFGTNYTDSTNPSIITTVLETPVTFKYSLQDGTEYMDDTTINPNSYDLNGTQTVVSTGKWTIQAVFLDSSGFTKIQYGQVEYSSKFEALAKLENIVVNDFNTNNAALRSFIIVQEGAVDLTDNTKCLFVSANKFGDINKPLSNDYNDLDNTPIFKVVENSYLNMAAMYADQGNQTTTFIQYVTDASAHPNVTTGSAYFEYLGTVNGDDTDYRLLSNSEAAAINASINKTSDIPLNDGQDGTSRYIQESEINSFVLMPPYLRELVPDTYLPSTTGNFILRGSFFTSDMVITVQGHTINYQTFVSSNEFLVNLTTSATEGNYDVTLDNGLSVTFAGVLQVVNGAVYEPTNLDWILSNTSLNVTEVGHPKTVLDASLHTGEWVQEFDYTKDFIVSMKLAKSPISTQNYNNTIKDVEFMRLAKVSDSSLKFGMRLRADANPALRIRTESVNDALAYSYLSPITSDWESSFDDCARANMEFRYISGVMYWYFDNTLLRTFTDTVTENLKLIINLKLFDLTDIKYIDLSDTSGGYIDYSKLISQFINDSNYSQVVTAPATAVSAGTAGQIAYDSSYIYICTATNTWLRAPIATW